MKRLILWCTAGWLVAAMVSVASADVKQVDIAAADIAPYVAANGGSYYVLSVTPPAEIKTVRQAWLELRAEVSVEEAHGFKDPAPLFEVFMLKNEFSGEPTKDAFETLRLPMSRPVALGTDRSIKIDVTEYVQRILADPSVNHGLVLGSLTSERGAGFSIKTDAFGKDVPARLTVVE